MSDIGSTLMNQALNAGASFRATEKVDLATIARKKFSWFSKKIRKELGVPDKPDPLSICPLCQKAKQSFELDHMGPWRVYVAAAAGTHLIKDPKTGKLLIDRHMVKILYNDPDNLWWICSDCNKDKSDKTYDTAAQLLAIAKGEVPDGEKGVDPNNFV